MYTHMYTDTHTYLPLRIKGLSALGLRLCERLFRNLSTTAALLKILCRVGPALFVLCIFGVL